MKRLLAAVILIAGLMSYGRMQSDYRKHVLLPNPGLLRCVSSECYQLWKEIPTRSDIYPETVILDFSGNPCPQSLLARYDKSVSVADLEGAIQEQYGKWAFRNNGTSQVKLWRVESERFSIQLGTADKQLAKAFGVPVGSRSVIYMAFQPAKCGDQ